MKHKLFDIHADYRKPPANNHYYVIADNARQAKKCFLSTITWLDVLSVTEMAEEEASRILSEGHAKHIIMNAAYT